MPDLIRLLPDTVANQIAAGEVIQRPASVVKELVENAVDAGAAEISIVLKDAGRTLIQVSDDGSGMSENDARMAFERHATSKISDAQDLFAIRTMGFRGEALASVAAIAEVEVRTRVTGEDIGTLIIVSGSRVQSHEPAACKEGTTIQVRNLFFNTPARRKFLKSDQTELKHILNEFNHIALAHTEIAFRITHNQNEIYRLEAQKLRKRIISLFGKSMNQSLVPLETRTSLVNILGYLGKPEFARKTYGEQFFFVNQRYMRHPYFHKAVMQAYEKILPPDSLPSYFIFFEIDPAKIDVNIHPTKTEIKFEDEHAIFQILLSSIREALGKHNVVPSIDFDQEGIIDIPLKGRDDVSMPSVQIDPDYNPFSSGSGQDHYRAEKKDMGSYWEEFLRKSAQGSATIGDLHQEQSASQGSTARFFQLKNRYILTSVKSGLMIIDQKRAHERILYEQFKHSIDQKEKRSQRSLFPQSIELNPADHTLLMGIQEQLAQLGFDIQDLGNHHVSVNACPVDSEESDPAAMLDILLESYRQHEQQMKTHTTDKIAISLARAAAIPYGRVLEEREMRNMVDRLFACSHPNYSPSGKPVIHIISQEELDKRFT